MSVAAQKRVTGKGSIFDSLAQVLVVDPKQIQPMIDRCLIEDIPESERSGSLFIPETAQGKEKIRRGIVRAVGLGDKWTEHGFDATGAVRRRAVTVWKKCEACDGEGRLKLRVTKSLTLTENKNCPRCGPRGSVEEYGRLPMYVWVGCKVLYQRRKESEISIGGMTYSLINEIQSILAVLED